MEDDWCKKLWCAVLQRAFEDIELVRKEEVNNHIVDKMNCYSKAGISIAEIAKEIGIKKESLQYKLHTHRMGILMHADLKNFFRHTDHLQFICDVVDLPIQDVIDMGNKKLDDIHLIRHKYQR